jgi:hypothetical protein
VNVPYCSWLNKGSKLKPLKSHVADEILLLLCGNFDEFWQGNSTAIDVFPGKLVPVLGLTNVSRLGQHSNSHGLIFQRQFLFSEY